MGSGVSSSVSGPYHPSFDPESGRFGPAGGEGPVVHHRRPSARWRVVALLVPALTLIGAIILYPLLSGVGLSFSGDPVLNRSNGFFYPGGFVGVDNYSYWLTQTCSMGSETVKCPPGTIADDFWPAVGNTFFFTVVTVFLETVIGIGMALVMAQNFRGRGLLRAAVLVPWAIPTAITAKLWAFLFAEQGIVNKLLGVSVAWQTDPWAARFSIILADVWKTTPFMALLILAGLQMIPAELYEAARVDGATAWQRFTRITLPMAKGSILVAVLFRMLDALRMYDLPYIMVGPNPDSPTATVSQLVVAAIRQDKVHVASALATLIFLMIFVCALFFVRVLGARLTSGADAREVGSSEDDEMVLTVGGSGGSGGPGGPGGQVADASLGVGVEQLGGQHG